MSWLEFVYDYCLAILGVDVLLDFLDVWHHLYVAAVDVDFDVVLFHSLFLDYSEWRAIGESIIAIQILLKSAS